MSLYTEEAEKRSKERAVCPRCHGKAAIEDCVVCSARKPAPRVVAECWTCDPFSGKLFKGAIERHLEVGHDVRPVRREGE